MTLQLLWSCSIHKCHRLFIFQWVLKSKNKLFANTSIHCWSPADFTPQSKSLTTNKAFCTKNRPCISTLRFTAAVYESSVHKHCCLLNCPFPPLGFLGVVAADSSVAFLEFFENFYAPERNSLLWSSIGSGKSRLLPPSVSFYPCSSRPSKQRPPLIMEAIPRPYLPIQQPLLSQLCSTITFWFNYPHSIKQATGQNQIIIHYQSIDVLILVSYSLKDVMQNRFHLVNATDQKAFKYSFVNFDLYPGSSWSWFNKVDSSPKASYMLSCMSYSYDTNMNQKSVNKSEMA